MKDCKQVKNYTITITDDVLKKACQSEEDEDYSQEDSNKALKQVRGLLKDSSYYPYYELEFEEEDEGTYEHECHIRINNICYYTLWELSIERQHDRPYNMHCVYSKLVQMIV